MGEYEDDLTLDEPTPAGRRGFFDRVFGRLSVWFFGWAARSVRREMERRVRKKSAECDEAKRSRDLEIRKLQEEVAAEKLEKELLAAIVNRQIKRQVAEAAGHDAVAKSLGVSDGG